MFQNAFLELQAAARNTACPPWISQLYIENTGELTIETMRKLFAGLRDLGSKMQFAEVDGILHDVEMPRLSVDGIVALLRYSNPIKAHLSRWDEILDRAKAELTSRGENTERLLRGLHARAP